MASVSVISSAASAQPARPAPEDQNRVSEIVVTARRSEERLQDTPVAVTATSGVQLARQQVVNVFDLQRTAPNVSVSKGAPASPTYAIITIRGQTNINGNSVNDPAIGLYFDGVYMGRASGALLDLDDVARVEVLRGPQGTLFGRNTTGGAISVVSNQPSPEFGGTLTTQLGDYRLREAIGTINVPVIGDQLMFRATVKHTEHAGYGKNHLNGVDVNSDNAEAARAALRYAPAELDWDFTLAADVSRRKGSGSLAVLQAFNPGSFLPAFVLANPPANDTIATYLHQKSDWWGTYSNLQPYGAKASGLSLVVNGKLGSVNLKTISAWRKLSFDSQSDSDGTPYYLLQTHQILDQEQVQHEVQASQTVGKLDWITGVFFFQEHSTDTTPSINYFAPTTIGQNFGAIKNTSLAAYAQVNYHVTDKLTLTGGLRETEDRRHLILFNRRNGEQPGTGFANPPLNTIRNCNNGSPNNGVTTFGSNDGPNDPAVLCQLTLDKKFHYLSYLASADYRLSEQALVYVKTSRAFLAGGWNSRGSTPARAFSPEQVVDVEAGAKVDWLDGRLRTNAAIYHAWQKNLQRTASAIDPATGTPIAYLINAGTGHVDGGEVEVTAVPWRGMTLNSSLGVTRARYDTFVDIADSSLEPGLQPLDRTGERYPAVPGYTWSVGGTQRLTRSYGEWVLHADYARTGSQAYFDTTVNPIASPAVQAAALGQKAASRAAAYGLLSAQVALELNAPHVTIAVWARNLTASKYYTRSFGDLYSSLGYGVGFVGDPRTVGARLTYEF